VTVTNVSHSKNTSGCKVPLLESVVAMSFARVSNTMTVVCKLESCEGRVNLHGLRVLAFAGRTRVEPGAGRAWDKKFFVRVTECSLVDLIQVKVT